jgi:Sir2- and TIR-associating SLOG family/SIR2-like domain
MNEAIKRFCDRYAKALEDGHAALFVGAGFSKPAGFVEWKELLRAVAEELGLNVDLEPDLISLAQYYVNEHGGNRHLLNTLLIEQFTRDTRVFENHRLIARLPLTTIWTTNYDQLIEQSYRDAYKRLDVKVTNEQLTFPLPKRDALLYKMHGCITQPHDAVLIKEDYETYNDHRALFSELLRGDLISKVFLFLGYSFNDPNIEYVLGRLRSLFGTNQPQHYWIVKRAEAPRSTGSDQVTTNKYEWRRQELRVNDLKRYGIQAMLIDDFSEITEMLEELNRRVHSKNIFVSGSAYEYSPMDRERTESLAKAIGREIIRRNYNLISGLGLGIGAAAMLGAAETVYGSNKINVGERVYLRPFPREALIGMTKEEFNTKHRQDIIATAGMIIFISGNNRDPSDGKSVVSAGVLEEFRIAQELGKRPIPIGATGHAARQIWQEVFQSLDTYFPEGGVKEHFAVLGDEAKTNDEIVNAVFAIAELVTSSR